MSKPKITKYNAPAGGWGAMEALGRALIHQQAALHGTAALLHMNQPAGFDCPGCGWGEPKETSPFEFCENGAKALAWEATSKRVDRDFFAAHTVTELAEQSDFWLEDQGRLTEPMAYNVATDKYVPIGWDEAFALVADTLRALSDPNQVEFYTSGRASNEAAFLFQLFARAYGTNNFPDCSNMCHEATSTGLPEQLGVGKGTVLIEDFDLADAVFIFGQNPGTNSPRMMTALRAISRRGGRIVTFNPLRERALERFQAPQNPIEMATLTSTPISTHYFQVRVGGDVAALKGIMKAIIAADDAALAADRARPLDIDFIRGHTTGFEALAADLRATGWPEIEAQSGLVRADLERAAHVYMEAERVIAVWGMGITQHKRGTENVQQIVNLLLLRGNIGRPGSGACPVRGHSNVQGNRTVGITEKPTPEFLDRLEQVFGFAPPRTHGHDVVEAIEAMQRGDAKVFIALGGNFAVATPDSEQTQAAMRRLDLTVAINTKLNRGHLVHGRQAVILPCLGRSEIDVQANGPQIVTVEDTFSMVHGSRGMLPPAAPGLRSETAIVAGMAAATLAGSKIPWHWLIEDYARIRDRIEAVFPILQGYNARIETPSGFHLTSTARERIWNTDLGKARFMIFAGIEEDPHQDDATVLWLTTLRSHDQYNTTLYSFDDRYRGVFGQRLVVFMNQAEMARRGLGADDRVDLETVSTDGQQRIARGFKVVPYAMPDGCCAAYYPETNGLVPLYARDERSHTPSYKAVPIRVIRGEAAAVTPVAAE